MPPRLKTRLKRYAPVRRLAPLLGLLRRIAHRLSPAAGLRTLRWLIGIAAAVRRRRREPLLTVAVDVLPLWEPLTGVGWYLYKLLEALAGRDDLRLRLYGLALVDAPEIPGPVVPLPAGPALEQVLYPVPDDLVLGRRWLLPMARRLEPVLLAADGNRVVFAPNFILPPPFALAVAGAPLVATIHDLGIRRLPWAVRDDTREAMLERLDRTLFQAVRLITPSAAVREDLATYGDADRARVRVVQHGLGQAVEAARRDGVGDRGGEARDAEPPVGTPAAFALTVGTLEPRKNLLTLIEARRILARRGAPPEAAPPLVLAGRYGWQTGRIRRAVDEATAEGWLVHFGYVSQRELVALYRRARLVALPSLYEGFGLPAVEAMWAGVPLLLADIPVFHEVAGDAALYAPPDRPQVWADRLAELSADSDLRRRLAARGRERARRFTWERAAAETAAVLIEAASTA